MTVKLRSGFDDRGLLRENLLAAQAGARPSRSIPGRERRPGHAAGRTGFAVDLLSVPVVGNGDVTSAALASKMLRDTGCAGVMMDGRCRTLWCFEGVARRWWMKTFAGVIRTLPGTRGR